MDLIALLVAAGALLVAALAHREAVRSSNRKLARSVHDELEELETFKRNLKRDWEEERDRLGKQARRTGATLKRLDEVLDSSSESAEGDASSDDGGADAQSSGGNRVSAMRPNLAQIAWRGGRTG